MFYAIRCCGRCGENVDFEFREVWEFGDRKLARDREDRGDMLVPADSTVAEARNNWGRLTDACAIVFCPRCQGPSLLEFVTRDKYLDTIKDKISKPQRPPLHEHLVHFVATYPAENEPVSDPDWPAQLVRKFNDVQRMLSQNMDAAFILTSCRSVLEIALKEIGDDARQTLSERINTLRNNGVITQPIADWAHAIRIDGNEAVHEGSGDMGNAREFVEFLKVFLNVAFSLPKRIERKRGQ